MTPHERAEKAIRLAWHALQGSGGGGGAEAWHNTLVDAVADAITAAVAEQKEACADAIWQAIASVLSLGEDNVDV